MICIEKPNAGDGPAITGLLDLCFGPDRQRKSSYHYRRGVRDLPDLRRIARLDEAVVGTIAYTPVRIGRAAALLLGPVAVCPGRRGQGIGRRLIRETLIQAEAGGHSRVVLVGDVAYYAQFGFLPAAAFGVHMAGEPARLLALALAPGAWSGLSGAVRPAGAGHGVDCAGERAEGFVIRRRG